MRTTKFLTILAPIATVGVIAPTVSLTSCGGSSYSLEYGQDINCNDPKGADYQKVKTIKSALLTKINVENTPQAIDLDKLNESLVTDSGCFQNIYFELIANYTIFRTDGLFLSDWVADQAKQTWSFKLNDSSPNKEVRFKYIYEDGKMQLETDDKNLKLDSYTYRLCWAKQPN